MGVIRTTSLRVPPLLSRLTKVVVNIERESIYSDYFIYSQIVKLCESREVLLTLYQIGYISGWVGEKRTLMKLRRFTT